MIYQIRKFTKKKKMKINKNKNKIASLFWGLSSIVPYYFCLLFEIMIENCMGMYLASWDFPDLRARVSWRAIFFLLEILNWFGAGCLRLSLKSKYYTEFPSLVLLWNHIWGKTILQSPFTISGFFNLRRLWKFEVEISWELIVELKILCPNCSSH